MGEVVIIMISTWMRVENIINVKSDLLEVVIIAEWVQVGGGEVAAVDP